MKKTTGVVELKAKTSEILRIVKAGHEVVVTERGVPVARLVPLGDAERRSTRRTRLFRAGLIKRGQGGLPKLLANPPEGQPVGTDVLNALLAERHDSSEDR
jgi:prevent-host-death family protein